MKTDSINGLEFKADPEEPWLMELLWAESAPNTTGAVVDLYYKQSGDTFTAFYKGLGLRYMVQDKDKVTALLRVLKTARGIVASELIALDEVIARLEGAK